MHITIVNCDQCGREVYNAMFVDQQSTITTNGLRFNLEQVPPKGSQREVKSWVFCSGGCISSWFEGEEGYSYM